MSDVVVLGSANVDLVMRVARYPGAGETVTAERVGELPGGKGLNQAVAAARAGARTSFVGTVGDDEHGRMLAGVLAVEGIDITALGRSTTATGMAVIALHSDGDNSIFVLPGANAHLEVDEAGRGLIAGSTVMVAQLEVPISAVNDALHVARAAGVRTILNAAPAAPLDDSLLESVDVLVVNEHEAALLGGHGDPIRAAAALGRSVGLTVVTLGSEGAAVVSRDGSVERHPGLPANAVDTTGAGDTFVGVLAAALAAGGSTRLAVERGVAAGAVAVERIGAVPSIPTYEEVSARLHAAYARGPETSRWTP